MLHLILYNSTSNSSDIRDSSDIIDSSKISDSCDSSDNSVSTDIRDNLDKNTYFYNKIY